MACGVVHIAPLPSPTASCHHGRERMKQEMTRFLQNEQSSEHAQEGWEDHLSMARSSG